MECVTWTQAELPQCEIWWGCKILKVRGKCPNVSQELRLSRFPPKTARQLYLIPISNNQNQNSNTTIITCWITSSLSVFDGVVKLALESSLEWKIWEENIKRVDLTVHDMKQSMHLMYIFWRRTSSPCGVISVTGKASKSSSVVMSCT